MSAENCVLTVCMVQVHSCVLAGGGVVDLHADVCYTVFLMKIDYSCVLIVSRSNCHQNEPGLRTLQGDVQ